jgi:putative transcriptional regulator
MKLKNRIRELRFQNGEMSQQALADAVDVTRMTIYSIEKEKFVPSALLAFKIAGAFGVDINDVFHLEDEQNGGEQ